MATRYWKASLLATLAWAVIPLWAHAQGTTGSSGGAASSSSLLGSPSSGGGGGSSGSSSQSVSAAIGTGLVTSAQSIAANSGTGQSATTIPSNSNYAASTYVNYFTLGQPSLYQGKFGAQNVTPNITGTFGKYIYVPAATTSSTASTTPTTGIGFTTLPQPRAPLYRTSFAETFPVARPTVAQVQIDARDAIASSTMLKNKNSIQVGMNGNVVLLSGTVGSETERTVAEGMVRMTPGVGDVLNNLTVDPSRK